MFALAFVSLLALTGCKTTTGPQFDPRPAANAAESLTNLTSVQTTNRVKADWLQPSPEPFILGPGDRIEIEIFGRPESRAIAAVGPDGKIYFYLLPGLEVWGLTLGQTKELLQEKLGKFFTEKQEVGVTLRAIESKRVWLLGRLQNSGIYNMAAPMTLLESLSLAGGALTVSGSAAPIADLQRSFIVRQGELLPVDFVQLIERGDMSQNVYLRPDDFVYLPSAAAREIYVLGAVRAPRAVEFAHELTVISAIANAGGTIKDAYLSHVAIVRGSLSEPKIAIVDYKEIIRGKAPDVRLEPRDIVYIPFSPYKTLAAYADLIMTTFVRAVAINEGVRAVTHDAVPVGVNIGIGPR